MSEFKIEKGVEPPSAGRGAPKYPIAQMEVGDSFFVPKERLPNSGAQGMNSLGIRFGFKLSVRRSVDGVRVWRIA